MQQILNPLLRAAQIIFGLFLAYFAFRIFNYHWALITFPYADALREGAMMTSTQALVHGMNPYAFALQPKYMNQYGIVYPLLVWPWASLFGVTMLVHRLVTAACIWASCLLVCLVLRRMKAPALLSIWAGLMLYASLTYPGTSTPTVDPGAAGTLFLLLTVFIPWFDRYSYKSLLASAVLGTIAFYAKPYALLGALIMASYLLFFKSWDKSIFYGLWLLFLSVTSIIVVNRLLPAYFDNCFFTSANMAPAWASVERLYLQIHLYINLHLWMLVLMAVLIGWSIFKTIQSFRPPFLSSLRMTCLKARQSDSSLIVYAGLCVSLALYQSLGRHTGALLWYFFQLLSPFLLIGAACLFGRFRLWPLICVPFLAYSLYAITLSHDNHSFNKNNADWAGLTKFITPYRHVLNSSLIAPLLIQQNKEIVDNGQAEYFLSGGQRNYWMKGWLKEDDRVYIQQILFFQDIRDNVQRKKYDVIVLQPSLLPMGVSGDIQKNYKMVGEFMLNAPQDRRSYALTIWLPQT